MTQGVPHRLAGRGRLLPSARSGPGRHAAHRAPPAAGGGSTGQRDPFFDNAKLFAIALVVAGHSWEPLTDGSRAAKALYLLVYAFHMPAFIVISGYFSRSFDSRPDRVQRLISGVAIPYLVFETAYSVFKRYADDDPAHPVSLVDPWYLTWFLAALFVWRLTAPIWRVVRWPLPLAVAVALLATTSNLGDELDLQRVFQFLPFFVLGLHLGPEHFARVRSRPARLAAGPVFAAALAFAYWIAPRVDRAWMYHRESSDDLGVSRLAGAATTLLTLGCSTVLTVAFLALVPTGRRWFTTLGTGTLYAFLLHGFLAKGSRYWGWYDNGFAESPPGAVVITAIAVTIALVLCSAPVRRLFRPVVEPRLDWAFRRGPGRAGSRARPRSGVRGAPERPTRHLAISRSGSADP